MLSPIGGEGMLSHQSLQKFDLPQSAASDLVLGFEHQSEIAEPVAIPSAADGDLADPSILGTAIGAKGVLLIKVDKRPTRARGIRRNPDCPAQRLLETVENWLR